MTSPDALLAGVEARLQANETRDVTLRAIAEFLREEEGYRWVGIYEVTPLDVRIVACTSGELPTFPVFSREQGLTAEAIRSRATVIVNDVARDGRYLTAFGTTRSEMIVPIFDSGEGAVVGTIDLESDREGAFSNTDRFELERVAGLLTELFTP